MYPTRALGLARASPLEGDLRLSGKGFKEKTLSFDYLDSVRSAAPNVCVTQEEKRARLKTRWHCRQPGKQEETSEGIAFVQRWRVVFHWERAWSCDVFLFQRCLVIRACYVLCVDESLS